MSNIAMVKVKPLTAKSSVFCSNHTDMFVWFDWLMQSYHYLWTASQKSKFVDCNYIQCWRIWMSFRVFFFIFFIFPVRIACSWPGVRINEIFFLNFFFSWLAHSQAVCWLTSRMCNHGMSLRKDVLLNKPLRQFITISIFWWIGG